MKTRLTSILFILFLNGCSSLPSTRDFTPTYEQHSETLKNYDLNKQKSAYVGDSLIESGQADYQIVNDGSFKSLIETGPTAYMLVKGKTYHAIYVDNKDQCLYIQGEKYLLGPAGAKVNQDGILVDSHMFYYNIGGWQGHAGVKIGTPGTKMFEKLPPQRIYSDNTYKEEIVYSGSTGSIINLLYREYKQNLASPAHYQQLSYDLSKSKIVRFRKYKIKIDNATNEQCTFTVIADK